MLRFDCPHCGNHLRLEDEYAGRDGWCRACKGMIVAPMPGHQSAGVEGLPLAVRYSRLYHLFKFAAAKADNYKLLFGRVRAQRERLTRELTEAAKWKDRATDAKRRADQVERQLRARDDELAQLMQVKRALEDETARLRADVNEHIRAAQTSPPTPAVCEVPGGVEAAIAEAKSSVAHVQQRLETTQHEKTALQEQVAALETMLAEARAAQGSPPDGQTGHERLSRELDLLADLHREEQRAREAAENRFAASQAELENAEARLQELVDLLERECAHVVEQTRRERALQERVTELEAAQEQTRLQIEEHARQEAALRAQLETVPSPESLERPLDTPELDHAQQARIDELETALEQSRAQLTAFGREKERLEARIEKLSADLTTNQGVDEHTLQGRIEELEAAQEQSRAQVADFAREKETLQARVEELTAGILAEQTRNEQALQARIEELEAAREQSRAQVEDFAREKEMLQIRIEELTAGITIEQARKEQALHAQIEELEAAQEISSAMIEARIHRESELEAALHEMQAGVAGDAAAAAQAQRAREVESETVVAHHRLAIEQHARQEQSLQARIDELESELQAAREQSETLARLTEERDALQAERDEFKALCDALEEDLASPSFGDLPAEMDSELLSPMPPAHDANDNAEHVIIPEIVMEDVEASRENPMISALLRFLHEREDKG
jgi:hypothetical protein